MKKEEIILTEYQKAQDSAEHYNTLIWTLISIGIGFSLLLIKLAIFDISDTGNLLIPPLILQNSIFFLGSVTLIYFGWLIEGANQKKSLKYKICQTIELNNKDFIGQNLGTRFLPSTKDKSGMPFFFLIKNLILLIFLFLSLIISSKAYNTSQSLGTTLLFLGTSTMFIINLILNWTFKFRKIQFDEVLLKIDELRNANYIEEMKKRDYIFKE